MKSLLLLVLTAASAFAELKLPSGVYRITELDKAIDHAAKQKQPLVTVCGNTKSTDKEGGDILLDTLKAAASLGVALLAENQEVFRLPPLILSAAEGKSLPPVVIISTPEGDKIWKVIAAEEVVKNRAEMKAFVADGIRACRADIKAWFAASPTPGPQLPEDQELHWPLRDNTTAIAGVFGRATAAGLYLKGADATGPPSYKMEDLSPATQRYLRYLTLASPDKKDPAPPAAPAVEKWTNTKGQILEAAFVSLRDNKITLRTAAGKVHTLALPTLSPESQARARALAAAPQKKEP